MSPSEGMTVGALKRRLDGMPDDWTLQVNVACSHSDEKDLSQLMEDPKLGFSWVTFYCSVDEEDVHAEGGKLILVVGSDELDNRVFKDEG